MVSSSALYALDEIVVMTVGGVDPMISSRAVETLVCGSSHDHRTKIRTRFKNGKKLRVGGLDPARMRTRTFIQLKAHRGGMGPW